jgi:Protein of unknown function (DUF2797)
MSTIITGNLRKMSTQAGQSTVEYTWVVNDQKIPLNSLLGQPLQLRFTGNIHCIQCGRKTRQSYQQGYCYPCMQRLAECNFCTIRPEKCRVHEGSCPQNDWAHSQCAQPHTVYLANSSGLKVGITRCTQLPTRWIDQGACQALPIFQVANRYQSGIIEMCLKNFVNDRTDWRKLLKKSAGVVNLWQEHAALMGQAEGMLREATSAFADDIIWLSNVEITELVYPVQCYPEEIVSLSFDKTALISGILQGIKGQYLLLDTGVINIRKFAGYELECQFN